MKTQKKEHYNLQPERLIDQSKFKTSKTGLLKGALCMKSYWLYYNRPDLRVPIGATQQAIIDHGIKVGLLARDLVPGGYDLTDGGKHFGSALLEKTSMALSKGLSVLYEASFSTADKLFFFQSDIIIIEANEIKLVEVKSSTSVKEKHLMDAAIQNHILKSYGFQQPIKTFIAYLNKEYVRQGDIDVTELFELEDISDTIIQLEPEVNKLFNECRTTGGLKKAPEVNIGAQCFEESCEFQGYCFKAAKVPEYSVFNMGGLNKAKAQKLFEAGYKEPKNIPASVKLTERQRVEVVSAKNGKPYFNSTELKRFMKELNSSAPMFYMDFETFNTPCPPFNGCAPWQQICFQYCVIYQKNPQSSLDRREFLAEPGKDPRRDFIESLLKDTKGKGAIAVYNQSFEITRLKELSTLFPDLSVEINERISRIKDVLIPFSKRYYWDSDKMRGSASIKKVLPALTGISYQDLEISNGAEAMRLYESLSTMTAQEQGKIMKDLKDYCFQDVYGLWALVKKLCKITSN